MSGHSKWASIKHKKAAVDKKRGAAFTKLARAITIAARDGGGDLEGNATLAHAVQKAKDASMPKDNIERAIAKGTGADKDAAALEEVVYEGYGPGGIALLIHCLTDNRNRTGSDVRSMLTKSGGSLGEPGSVAWNFEKKGVFIISADDYGEDDLFVAIDAGADDINAEEEVFEVTSEPANFAAVRGALEAASVEMQSAEVIQRPKTRTEVSDSDAGKLFRLIDALEEHDDVAEVAANFDVSEEALQQLAAG
ncbi:MAG TPA: YebC/PmpR family DNA-binding transcriptional regulator [Solirubrobacterales bacterium]|jgi:YebC/PmpR family DNA-binding regulatory protein|nr:YebC/PmpR family DNA-binding transcriptional regulator [Solirubrobacterales bacterium]